MWPRQQTVTDPAQARNGDVTDGSELLRVRFDVPGVHATLTGTRGEAFSFTRASVATLLVGGAEVTAQANQMRVDEDGLLIEPATANFAPTPTNLASASYTPDAVTIAAGHADPLGGTTAFRMLETAANAAHYLYCTPVTAAVTTAFSIYVKPIGRTFFKIATNSAAQYARFEMSANRGSVVSVYGSGTRGEIEYVGKGWYRLSMIATPAAGGNLILFGLQTDATTESYAGDVAKGCYLWRPQIEANQYATTWTETTRAVEAVSIPIPPLPHGGDWCFEIIATPCGAQSWKRGAEIPILSLGTYHAGNSLEAYSANGNCCLSVYDSSAAEKLLTGGALAGAAQYLGPRRLAFGSVGIVRPEVWIDGRQQLVTLSGAGTGILNGQNLMLRLGAVSSGLTGGIRVRDIRVLSRSVPPTRIMGATSHEMAHDRGYIPTAGAIAFLGDSNTEGIYDVSITAPYCVGACATLGEDYQPHNFGVGSNVAQQCLDRFRADISGHDYAKMVVFAGINDLSLSMPVATVTTNLQRIYEEAKAEGIEVYPVTLLPNNVAVGQPYRDALDAVNAWIRAYATANGLHLIEANTHFDDGTGKIAAAWDLDGGSLHLSQAGQTEMAAIVAAALAL